MILTACVKNGTTAHFTSDWKLWRLNSAIIEAKQNSQIVSNFRGCRVFKSRLVTSFIMDIGTSNFPFFNHISHGIQISN
jgi:hypothetical protein